MPVDFTKLGTTASADTVIQPRDVFSVLPAKAAKYQYPRDVQTEVWAAWFARRDQRDTVIKMNTGSGKTVVGLLILKSCLNEKRGPAVYVTPDKYLTSQVLEEARSLGISTATDPTDPSYARGDAILVINVYKLINGRSVFGVRDDGVKIRIGSILVDDVHACLATTENQFTIRVARTSELYDDLFALFRDDLAQQSPTGILDIEAEDPTKLLLVPFWAWHKKIDEVASFIHKRRDEDDLRFVWRLLSESLSLCQCVIGGDSLEISPRCLPIDAIPSFASAHRRIFTSATLADDSVLVTHFDVSAEAASNPITPSNANDVGDRLILVPQELNPDLDDDAIRALACEFAEDCNVVVIVPSFSRADFWGDHAVTVLTGENLQDGISDLKAGHVGLVVIVNRYDGIDLPNDACRLLVIDGLPEVRNKIDRIDDAILQGTDEHIARTMQRIEQGMGRGIRSSDDWCVVLLMGRRMSSYLYVENALDKFTPATRAQYDLSQRLATQLRGQPATELAKVIQLVLGRDAEWGRASKGALVHVKYDRTGRISAIALAQRRAFGAMQLGDNRSAIAALQEVVNTTSDRRTRGWLKQQLAEAIDFTDQVASQVILRSGIGENRFVLRPIEGIAYERLQSDSRTQAAKAIQRLMESELPANHFLVEIYQLLDDLKFIPGTAPKFEKAFAQLARICGWDAQQPEAEFGRGPDVLWSLGELRFLVIECKNGATTGTIAKSDVNQLTGSMNWFREKYDTSCSPTPVMVHPNNLVSRASSPNRDMKVVTIEDLANLKRAVKAFGRAVAAGSYPPDERTTAGYLAVNKLTSGAFITSFTTQIRQES